MAKFKVLKVNQAYMSWLGLYSHRLNEQTNEFFKSIGSYYNLISMIALFVTSALFIHKNYSTDITAAMNAIKVCVSTIQWVGIFLGLGLNMIKIKSLHSELQQIVDEDNDQVNDIYWNCEQKCRKITQRSSYYVLFHTSSFIIVLIYALVCIAFGKYDTSSWYLSFYVVVPFDQTRVSGWLMTWLFQFLIAFSYSTSMTSITSYFVSCCYYIYAICDHSNLLIKSLEADVERLQVATNAKKITEIHRQLQSKFGNMVEFQIKIYKIFQMLVGVFSLSIFALIPTNAIFLSMSMFDVEVSASNAEFRLLLWSVSCTLCALFWVTIICYFASHVTDRISSIDNMIYHSRWPEYPVKLQKFIILAIARSQQSVNFTGFGLFDCTLELFAKLCKTSSSYYLMFRAIGNHEL